MAKEFRFRGLSWDEILHLKDGAIADLLTSRARRTLRRAKDLDKKIQRAIKENVDGLYSGKPVKTHRRDILILPKMVGLKFGVYDGRDFQTVWVTKEMVGFPLGEFVETRKRPKHSKAGIGATKSSKHIGKK